MNTDLTLKTEGEDAETEGDGGVVGSASARHDAVHRLLLVASLSPYVVTFNEILQRILSFKQDLTSCYMFISSKLTKLRVLSAAN